MCTTHKSLLIFHNPLLFAALILGLASCEKNDKTVTTEHLTGYSQVAEWPANSIRSTLLSFETLYPEVSAILDNIVYDVKIYKINYKTTFHDSTVQASGLACIPVINQSFPVISFQNGTNTIHSNAPSVNPFNQNYLMLEYIASAGYIMLIPDYLGFGASEDMVHPYYDRTATNNAIIDLINAFNELSQSGQIASQGNDSLFLMGYSQGGGATISVLQEMENGNNADMNIIAVSAGAGAYNLTDMTHYVLKLETYPSPLYFPYFIYSQKAHGAIDNPLSDFFNEPYATNIPGLFDGEHSSTSINNSLSESISELFTSELINHFDTGSEFAQLRTALQNSSIQGWNTNSNINLYHGTLDDNVPPSQSDSIYSEFMQAGASPSQVQYIHLDGMNHSSGLLPWGMLTISWFNSFRQ